MSAVPNSSGQPLLEVKDLKMHFPVTEGVLFQKQVAIYHPIWVLLN
ncbi:MAG: hypothetical protein VW257_04860 [Quisquiliibacterium sp.]